MFIPISVDVPARRLPIANVVLVAVICLVSIQALLYRAAHPRVDGLERFAYLFDPKLTVLDQRARLRADFPGTSEGDLMIGHAMLRERIRQHVGGSDAHVFAVLSNPQPSSYDGLALRGWSVTGMIGCVLLHADPVHLIGNMLFLWLFGNAVCAKLGDLIYLGLFAALAWIASAVHLAIDGRPAIGASGAINGVVGLYLMLYPLNEITMLWGFAFRFGTMVVSGMWVILMWFLFDLWGLSDGTGRVAYAAHIGGLVGGVGAMTTLLLTRAVATDGHYERSLLDLIGLGHAAPRPAVLRPTYGSSSPTPALPARPRPRPASNRIDVLCLCGKLRRVTPELAGKRGKCADCGQVLVVPART